MFILPFPPSVLNPNTRAHWSKKAGAAKKYRSDCAWIASRYPAMKKFKITFRPPRAGKRDRDNLIAAFKAGQDGLADAWGIDDSLFEITYAPLGEKLKDGGVIVEAV